MGEAERNIKKKNDAPRRSKRKRERVEGTREKKDAEFQDAKSKKKSTHRNQDDGKMENREIMLE